MYYKKALNVTPQSYRLKFGLFLKPGLKLAGLYMSCSFRTIG